MIDLIYDGDDNSWGIHLPTKIQDMPPFWETLFDG